MSRGTMFRVSTARRTCDQSAGSLNCECGVETTTASYFPRASAVHGIDSRPRSCFRREMTSYVVFDVAAVEGRRKPVAHELGARAIRLNQFDSAPGQPGFEHHERESGQEEIYIPLRGRGVLRVDGAEVALEPGRYVATPLEETYQTALASVPRRWRTVLESG